MLVERKSPMTGKPVTMEIDVTEEQLADWDSGMLIQKAMPNLTADEREFILTGLTAEEWDEVMSDIEQEDLQPEIQE